MPVKDTCLSVGEVTMNSAVCVPVILIRAATLSPSAIMDINIFLLALYQFPDPSLVQERITESHLAQGFGDLHNNLVGALSVCSSLLMVSNFFIDISQLRQDGPKMQATTKFFR